MVKVTVPVAQRHSKTPSMSIRTGTEQILDLIAHEVAVARAEISKQTQPRIAALEDQCRILKDSLTVAQQGLQNAVQNADNASRAGSRLQILQTALENSGFMVDSDYTVKFGPMFSTLALEVAQIAGSSHEATAEPLLRSSMSGIGILDLLQTVKLSLEEGQKTLTVWKHNCEAARKERDDLKEAATKNEATISSKNAEIDNLQKELITLTKRSSPSSSETFLDIISCEALKSSLERRAKPDDESSDSDVPLATSSKRYRRKHLLYVKTLVHLQHFPAAEPLQSTSPPSPKRRKVNPSPAPARMTTPEVLQRGPSYFYYSGVIF
jgi:hypothetical protein